MAFACLGKKIDSRIFNERLILGWRHKVSMSCGIFVQFFQCEISTLGKFVSFITSCTLCIAEVESVEAEGVIRLTGGQPPGRQSSWTTGDGLGITEKTTTVLNI
jgi:hypothetical protein